ncbi:MAG: ABC transporter substrate-binding protein [Hyphomicrobiaceae bacterium]
MSFPVVAPAGLSAAVCRTLVQTLAAALALLAVAVPAFSLGEKPFTIAVMYSSDKNRCFTPGVVTAIQHFTQTRANEINARGGIGGRRIKLAYYDDFATLDETVKNVRTALKDESLIGIIGISSSTRGNAVITDIGGAGVPLISGMSRGDIYAPYRNAFSMEPSVGDEIITVRNFIKVRGFERPAFIGFGGDLYAERIEEALNPKDGEGAPITTHWLAGAHTDPLDEIAADKAITSIEDTRSDIVFLAIHSGPGAHFLRRMRDANVSVPVFVVLGRISRMKGLLTDAPYNQDMYELGREGVPDVYNERLQQRIWKDSGSRWIFDDARSPNAKASCATDYIDPTPIVDVRSRQNRRAVGRGVQHGDALMLMAEAASGLSKDVAKKEERALKAKLAREAAAEGLSKDAAARKAEKAFKEAVLRKVANAREARAFIGQGLRSFRKGQKIYRGWWQDWSFTPSRAVGEQTLLVRQRADETATALAPVQYVQRGNDVFGVPVVNIAVDLVRIYQVDSNEKTFQAEFYLSFRTDGKIGFEDIDFTNAFRSPLSNKPVISERQIKGTDENSSGGLQLYKVTGKFMFDPELNQYPFDSQRFSISFQPSNATKPFFIQPPPPHLRKADFNADGWRAISSYVGSDQDIISVIGRTAGEKVIIPLDKFNYTWTMKRLATDYYLQVVVPLIVILAVTYLSIFIPAQRLESVVAIQVTALLSSIALYLAIPKVDFDQATTSDIVFVVSYTAISLMLGLSILRVNLATRHRNNWAGVVKGIQLVALPIIVLGMSDFVLGQNSPGGISPIRLFLTDVVTSIHARML